MALTRRELLWGGTALTLASCARVAHAPASPVLEEIDRVRKPGSKELVLVLMPSTPQTREVWTALSDELAKQYELVAVRIDSREDASIIARAIARYAPRALVLMNNPTMAAYRELQTASPAGSYPPAVVAMTSFLDAEQSLPFSTTGISYEVPLITVVTNLRRLIAQPVERVGVVRRARLATFVEQQKRLASHERITVEEEEVSHTPNASEIKRALRRVRHRSDALWVLNDDRLLTPRLIADGWLPGLAEHPWIPTIVGATSLVSNEQSFGTVAMVPDHAALGVQVASLVFDIADSEWTVAPDAHPQLAVSITTTLDLDQVQRRFTLRDGALAHVDRIVR